MEWKIIGIIAAICTTSGFIPQIIRGLRTKRLDDVSPVMCILLIFGLSMWLSYGIHIEDMIIIVANGFGVLFSMIIITLRFKYMRQR
ncbi:MAG: SemiSWEET family sugar transporter [Planctomycetota bacterium]|jgi:MtN3 and saliva related transmembrane protein